MTTQTRITLKKVRIAKNLSEETLAYTADIYFDGEKVAYARNDGCGGETLINPFQNTFTAMKRADEFACSLPADTSHGITIDSSLAWVVYSLAYDEEIAQELKSRIKRGVMFIKGSAENPQGPIYRLRVPRGRKVSEGLDAVRKRGYTPINDLPFDVALRLYKELE